MGKYTIYEVQTKELQVDVDELKSIFQDDWDNDSQFGCTDEDFVRLLVEDYGIDEMEESLVDGPFSIVTWELSIVNEG